MTLEEMVPLLADGAWSTSDGISTELEKDGYCSLTGLMISGPHPLGEDDGEG